MWLHLNKQTRTTKRLYSADNCFQTTAFTGYVCSMFELMHICAIFDLFTEQLQ